MRSRVPRSTIVRVLFLLLCLASTTAAHAEPAIAAAFRSGQPEGTHILAGDAAAAPRILATFASAVHTLIIDEPAQRAWWGILTADGKEAIALCPEPRWDEATKATRFEGTSDRLEGATLRGEVRQTGEKAWALRLTVKHSQVEFEFGQTLEPLGQDATSPSGEEAVPAGEYRHPTGIRLRLPEGWQVTRREGVDVLVPPDATENEVYLAKVGPSMGIPRADDPRAIEGAEALIRSIAPSLKRVGGVEAVPAGKESGALLSWEGFSAADGSAWEAKAFVVMSGEFSFVLLGLTPQGKLAPRAAALREALASFERGEGERDPALVGTWEFTKSESKRSGDFTMVFYRKVRAAIHPDGRVEMVETSGAVGGGADTGVESEDQTGSRARWYAARGVLFLLWEDGSESEIEYGVEGSPGSRRISFRPGLNGISHLDEQG